MREAGEAHLVEGADDNRFPIYPQRLVADVRAVMGDLDIIALDNGVYKIWFARNYKAYAPNTVLLDNALATMGAGLPSAIAAKLVRPEQRVMAMWRRRLHDVTRKRSRRRCVLGSTSSS